MKINRKKRKIVREKYPKSVIRKALISSISEKELKNNLELQYESYKRTIEYNYNPNTGMPVNNTKGPCHQ